MKPFNLQAALAGEAVVTRDGAPARIICFDRKEHCGQQSLIVLTTYPGNYETIQVYGMDGVVRNSSWPSSTDLFMASVKREGWVNIYPNRKGDETSAAELGAVVYVTEEAARNAAASGCVDTVKVTWEE